MMADCPKCGAHGSVDYRDPFDFAPFWIDQNPPTCECDECGARFSVDMDADWTGDHYQDCSTPGKEIEKI